MIEELLREIYGWAEADRSAPTSLRYVDFLQEVIDKITKEIEKEDPGEVKRNQIDESYLADLTDQEMEQIHSQKIVTLLALKDYADTLMEKWISQG